METKASDCKCNECGKQAVAFWPAFDPDIRSYAWCRKCLDERKIELMIRLGELNCVNKKKKDPPRE